MIIKHIYFGGGIEYRNSNGKTHNPHRHAWISPKGESVYSLNGEVHNIVGPAVLNNDQGDSDWYINGRELV